MREHLKNAPKKMIADSLEVSSSDQSDSSDSSDDSDSSGMFCLNVCSMLNYSMAPSDIVAFVSSNDTISLFESIVWVVGKGTLQSGRKRVLEAEKST